MEKRIIDSPDFQRLRCIRQLATAHLVYPGANHTRFEHSLGTLHLASQISSRLGLGADLAAKVRLYALLHDIGHTAFSHEAERLTSRHLGAHEEIGRGKVMKGAIGDIVSENFDRREIADFGSSPHARIVSSDIGADRMDYLKRDAHYTGVAYGVIDAERIICKMRFERGELWVEEGALEASESLLVARFMMFSTVYLHHTVRIASAMLERAISLGLGGGMDPSLFLENGDQQMLALLSRDKRAAPYASALLERRLYKQACSLDPKSISGKGIGNLEAELSSHAGCDIIIDAAPNFFKLSGFKVGLHGGGKKDIREVSELVRSLAAAEESRKRVLVLAPAENREKAAKACAERFSR